ncbi:hypothetical protein ALC57_03107 [Trachymyrmex cornetzi]|uniref:Uncharacterized protein n=1 Tax=Trachymyrmex cornetzi TaxID=471704 RepID=A0A151JMG1_9HYME|nr:hypothetical protein ALC57_03107 [Trachymyrmex cornetzi]
MNDSCKCETSELLEVYLEKVTSRRGPYDLFTERRGKRRKFLVTHYGCKVMTIYISIRLRSAQREVTRIMLQDISMCYKDPDEPGPGHYNPRTLWKPSSHKRYPPRRYEVKQDFCIKRNG